MTNFDRVSAWLKDAGQKPENFNAQLAADIEEIGEYFEAITMIVSMFVDHDSRQSDFNLKMYDIQGSLNRVTYTSKMLQEKLKNIDGEELFKVFTSTHDDAKKELLDAICDREVTANGLCAMLGFDKNLADQLVQDSNDSKLLVDEDGNRYAERNEFGKIIKPASFISVDLSDCIGE